MPSLETSKPRENQESTDAKDSRHNSMASEANREGPKASGSEGDHKKGTPDFREAEAPKSGRDIARDHLEPQRDKSRA